MEGLLLNSVYDTKSIIDIFESFIWTDRYNGSGDFEIYMPISAQLEIPIKQDDYIYLRESDRLMIVEQLETKTDVEKGTFLIVSGRSLESILDRRIIWGQALISGSLQNSIQLLLNENVISPVDADRKIPGFIFKPSTDPAITSLTINAQFMADNLYDAIYVLCDARNLGFRVLPDGPGGFIFELYKGADRSYGQDILPTVVFSPSFENLLGSTYLETNRLLRTVALVGGEGEGSDRLFAAAKTNGGGSGLSRRETFVDATGISLTAEGGEITLEDYLEQLENKGHETLADTKAVKSFEGQIDATNQFVYGKDFFIGDIVQVVNEYGMEARSRVFELIRTHDGSGESFIPTFVTLPSNL